MSKRAERRAAERAAHKAGRNQPPQPAQLIAEAAKTLAAASFAEHHFNYDPNGVFRNDPYAVQTPGDQPIDRAAINRANAQKSTGPTSSEGKKTSSLNALKHGLTGNTVLLDSDDAEAYQQRLDAHVEQFKPVTFEERRLVQSIHDAAWRLDRIISLEATIYAKGRIELEGCYYELPEDQRKSFIQLETAERNAKALRNLHIQEARLQRQRAKDISALNLLIQQRHADQEAEQEAKKQARHAPPIGFEFSNHENSTPAAGVPVTSPLAEAGKPADPTSLS